MNFVDTVHGRFVHKRRVSVLADRLAALLPREASVLDVGSGDGWLASLIEHSRPDVSIHGLDVLVRPNAKVPVTQFDGVELPLPDKSIDVVMFVDVLHHTDDPLILLREAARVARVGIVIKDHTLEGPLADETLRVMDWVGNARYGVALPYNYWPRERWVSAFHAIGTTVEHWDDRLGLYPFPLGLVFERSLHFVAHARVNGAVAGVQRAD